MRSGAERHGIYDCDATNPKWDILDKLIAAGATSFDTLTYLDPAFSDSDPATGPKNAEVVTLLESIGTNFVQTESSMELTKTRVAGRVCLWALPLIRMARSATSDRAEEPDAPLASSTTNSVDSVYLSCYGETPAPSSLPMSRIIAQLFRGMSSTFPVLRLQHMVSMADPRCLDDDVWKQGSAPGEYKKSHKKAKCSDPASFLSCLGLMLNGVVYIGAYFLAPAADWSGDPNKGIVAGKRRQVARADVALYYEFYVGVAERFRPNMGKLIAVEASIRARWTDDFRFKVRLGECITTSIISQRGVVMQEAALVNLPRPNPNPRPTGGGGAGGGQLNDGQKRKFADIAKLPGFKEGLRTCAKTEDGHEICKFYNDARKCFKTAATCPKRHVCDVMVDGKACGSTQHNRLNHE